MCNVYSFMAHLGSLYKQHALFIDAHFIRIRNILMIFKYYPGLTLLHLCSYNILLIISLIYLKMNPCSGTKYAIIKLLPGENISCFMAWFPRMHCGVK